MDWFNNASIRYLGYNEHSRGEKILKKDFVPRIYFIRQVIEDNETGDGYIYVLHEKVKLSTSYINFLY